jgi:Protein of unknown function (DUF3108)
MSPFDVSLETVSLSRRLRSTLLSACTAVVRLLTLFVLAIALVPYTVVPVYSFRLPAPFAGSVLFNPYQGSGPIWQRANFHAHSRAWGGTTSGGQSPDSVRAAYLRRGYSVIGLSNYHSIARAGNDSAFLPMYEHGFSIKKTHQLVIGATHVTALDFPVWQTASAKQFLLNQLHDSASLTAIVHPYMRTGYDSTEIARLGAYDLLEVRSHWDDASLWWDAALSAGNPVWGIGNDDVHDITKPRETGVVWTMVNAPDNSPTQVLSALRRGQMYVVSSASGNTTARLVSVTVAGDTITTRFSEPMQQIRVLGDNGTVRAESSSLAEMRYVFSAQDHYARVVATTASAMLTLNPVIRSSSGAQPVVRETPSTQPLASAAQRLLAALSLAFGVLVLAPGAAARALRGRLLRRRAPLRAAPVALAMLVSLSAPVNGLAQSGASRLPFHVGEYNEYDLKFGAITVGSGSLSVLGPETLRGREVIRLRYAIDGGIPFFRVHDVMESWFDPVRMHSLRFTQDLNEGPKRYDRLFDFYPDESVVVERGKPREPSVAQPLDDAAFIFFVRTLPLEVGQTLSFSRYFRPDANPVTIKVLRRESITVPAGTFSTIVIQPIIKTSGIFSEGGRAELWLSDDSTHRLIQMKARLSFGSLSLYLRPSRNRR